MSVISKILYKISINAGGIVKVRFKHETKRCREVNEKVLFNILKANCKRRKKYSNEGWC